MARTDQCELGFTRGLPSEHISYQIILVCIVLYTDLVKSVADTNIFYYYYINKRDNLANTYVIVLLKHKQFFCTNI